MPVESISLDITPYQATPQLPLEALISLTADLERAMPSEPPLHIERSAKRMLGIAGEAREEFVARIAEGRSLLASEVSFDNASDRFWGLTRRRLEFWMAFEQPGLELLDEGQRSKVDLAGKRALAAHARELDARLFGDEGLAFLRKSFAEQVVSMGTRLRYLSDETKLDLHTELLGPELLDTLTVVQERYETMVHERATRVDASANLRVLRSALQRSIGLYASAVLTLLDDEDEATVELITTALRPMVNARSRRTRSVDGSVVDEGVEGQDGVDAEADEAKEAGEAAE